MTSKSHDEVVTRQARRFAAKRKAAVDDAARKDIVRTRIVRKHAEEQGLEFNEQAITKKAFIEALQHRKSVRSISHTKRKEQADFISKTSWYIQLSKKIARLISRDYDGIMWGDSLDELYYVIADMLDECVSVDEVELAVDIAIQRKLLAREEATSRKYPERMCVTAVAA